MDTKTLKKIIKEAVKEGFREVLIENQRINEGMATLNFNSSHVPHVPNMDKTAVREQLMNSMGINSPVKQQAFKPSADKPIGLSILEDFARTVNPAELNNFKTPQQ
jgi:hypothetical protein